MSDYSYRPPYNPNFSLDDKSIRSAYEILNARRGFGAPLSVELGGLMEKSFGADLSSVRIHTDAAAKVLTAHLGADALACGDDLFFAPGKFAPQTRDGFWLLSHELAHSIQQRGGTVRESLRKNIPSDNLEREADDAATAVLKGRRPIIAARGECPEMLPVAPVVIWAILAAITAAGGAYSAFGRDEDMKKDAAKPEGYHDHEGLLAFIPVYGSIDQIVDGRSAASRMFGTFMLILDISTVGTVVRGIAIGYKGVNALRAAKAAASAAEKQIVKEGEKQAVKDVGKAFIGEAVKVAPRAEVAAQIETLLRGNKAIVIAVNELPSHSAVYLVSKTRIWKVQGGFYKHMMTTKLKDSRKVINQIATKSNNISLYEVEANTMKKTLNWAKELSKLGWWDQLKKTSACSGTQLLVLEHLGLGIEGVAASGFSKTRPLFPYILDTLRLEAGHNGKHYILNKSIPPLVTTGLEVLYVALPHAIGELGFPLAKFLSATMGKPVYGVRVKEIPLGMYSFKLGNSFWQFSSPHLINLEEPHEATAAPAPKPPAKRSMIIEVEPPNLSIQEQKILDQLEFQIPKSPTRISRLTGLTEFEVATALQGLKSKMLIRWASFTPENTGYVKNYSVNFNSR